MNGAIEERVAAAKLTENDKRVLDFIMANRRTACFLTSNEIAAQLGASPSSVVRLSKKLEYENFSAFKRALQEEVAGAPRFEALPVPHERIKEYENLPDEEILAAYMDNVLKNLRGDTNAENDRKIIDAADIILRARRVFIVGFRTCAGFASTAGVKMCIRDSAAPESCDVALDDDDEFDAHNGSLRYKIYNFTVPTPVIILSVTGFLQAAASPPPPRRPLFSLLSLFRPPRRIRPVSYTHLDVYKRQGDRNTIPTARRPSQR